MVKGEANARIHLYSLPTFVLTAHTCTHCPLFVLIAHKEFRKSFSLNVSTVNDSIALVSARKVDKEYVINSTIMNTTQIKTAITTAVETRSGRLFALLAEYSTEFRATRRTRHDLLRLIDDVLQIEVWTPVVLNTINKLILQNKL